MKRLLPALLVIGSACTLGSGPAAALELGPINIQSGLGQPLKASISYALNPNEQLHSYCVSLKPGTDAGPLPSLTRAKVSVKDNMIILTGTTPIREPMLTTQVAVNCPYTIKLARNFLLMINPAEQRPEIVANQRPAALSATGQAAIPGPSKFTPPATLPERVQTTAQPAAARDVVVAGTPIAEGSSYQVQAGDTLTGIVSRIANRSTGFWQSVEAIHVANPDAFLDGNRDLLQEGSVLTIPNLVGGAPAAVANVEPQVSSSAAPANEMPTIETAAGSADTTAALSAYDGYEVDATAAVAPKVTTEPVEPMEFIEPVVEPMDDTAVLAVDEAPVVATPQVVEEVTEAPAEETAGVSNSQFGLTISGDEESPQAVAGEEPVATPPADEQPTEQPRAVPVVTSAQPAESGSVMSWLIGLGAAGLAFLIAFYLIRRRKAEQSGDTPAGITDPETGNIDIDLTAKNRIASDVDFQFDSPPVEEPAVTLDADLGEGTGLQDGADMDVAQDFGFSADSVADSSVDLELPEEAAEDPEPPSTDIIPVTRVPEPTILDSEVPPEDGDDDEDYNLSMIVDATKQSMNDDEQTAKDLKAVPIDDGDVGDAAVTVEKHVDLKTLEQDYEDELTATQAFNEDIAKAAEDLALGLDSNAVTEVATLGDDDDTSISATLTTLDDGVDDTALSSAIAALEEQDNEADIPTAIAPMDEEEVTIEMTPTGQDELTANLETLDEAGNDEFEPFEVTVVNEELTDEVPELGLEPTVEMEMSSDDVDSTKTKAS